MLRLFLVVCLTLGNLHAVDNLERWLYEQRPVSFGAFSEPIIKDSRLGHGCWQKNFSPNAKGVYTARYRSVTCPDSLRLKPMPCGKDQTPCEQSPVRRTPEVLLLQRPYEMIQGMTQGTFDLLRGKTENE